MTLDTAAGGSADDANAWMHQRQAVSGTPMPDDERPLQQVDVAFRIRSSAAAVPPDLHGALAAALTAACPGWADAPGSGAHALQLSAGGWLSQRSRLVLRVERTALELLMGPCDDQTAMGLVDIPLDLGLLSLQLHAPQVRELLPWPCLYAHMVVMTPPEGPWPDNPAAEELHFLQTAAQALQGLGVRGRLICGRALQRPSPFGMLRGYSLMVDQLSLAHARVLLEQGLGLHRKLGCGLFVPHKSTAAVGVPTG